MPIFYVHFRNLLSSRQSGRATKIHIFGSILLYSEQSYTLMDDKF